MPSTAVPALRDSSDASRRDDRVASGRRSSGVTCSATNGSASLLLSKARAASLQDGGSVRGQAKKSGEIMKRLACAREWAGGAGRGKGIGGAQ